jgi:hypothetical protein
MGPILDVDDDDDDYYYSYQNSAFVGLLYIQNENAP